MSAALELYHTRFRSWAGASASSMTYPDADASVTGQYCHAIGVLNHGNDLEGEVWPEDRDTRRKGHGIIGLAETTGPIKSFHP